MPTATSPPPLPPAMLAQRYRLERRLAQGGMAEVWLANDTLLSRHVAIKLLKPTLAADPVIAERFRREDIADAAGDDLTSANIMRGTAKYLSPEQVRGRKLDGRADLYSLGLVLYECLARRVPFLGETDADTALARLNRDPTDLNRLRPTLPYGLAELMHRLLARRPEDRP